MDVTSREDGGEGNQWGRRSGGGNCLAQMDRRIEASEYAGAGRGVKERKKTQDENS